MFLCRLRARSLRRIAANTQSYSVVRTHFLIARLISRYPSNSRDNSTRDSHFLEPVKRYRMRDRKLSIKMTKLELNDFTAPARTAFEQAMTLSRITFTRRQTEISRMPLIRHKCAQDEASCRIFRKACTSDKKSTARKAFNALPGLHAASSMSMQSQDGGCVRSQHAVNDAIKFSTGSSRIGDTNHFMISTTPTNSSFRVTNASCNFHTLEIQTENPSQTQN